jgi:DNA segregation ATPase FtsK/SpoIIIE, S-DNA-T family
VEEQWLSKISFAAKSALQQLHLQAKLLDASLTPNSAWLRFAGSSNLTVDQVLKKRSGLLTTFGLNVISVRPEPGAVVIAVEREIREFIDIRHVWSRWEPRTEWWGNQDLLVGTREHDGSLLFLSPGHEDRTQTALAKSANRNIG